MWRRRTEAELLKQNAAPVSEATLRQARVLVERVREEGVGALLELRQRFDGIEASDPLVLGRSELEPSLLELSTELRETLIRTVARIDSFARAQRACFKDLTTKVPGGRAGHRFTPLERAACYGPGGRYPLPSSILMTVATAKAAGVPEVVAVTPRASTVMRAAAFLAGADQLLISGGAQAIAACAFGKGIDPVDIIVGPGNEWVTAAKQLVNGTVDIDMLAGPSELVIIADGDASASLIAADLLAQAEHDTLARPILLTDSESQAQRVRLELEKQLGSLPTAEVARAALANGGVVVTPSLETACALSDRLAPEHLELLIAEPESWKNRLRNYGALFVGSRSAEVFGDYGSGPNHVLPTGGSARRNGGLSVLTFLRARTWLELDSIEEEFASDVERLALCEGLHGHQRAVVLRRNE
ncbi:MAG: histidinol dehydrogenase [Planctomycetota bacterium]|jgi:histidinol dehydrogenase